MHSFKVAWGKQRRGPQTDALRSPHAGLRPQGKGGERGQVSGCAMLLREGKSLPLNIVISSHARLGSALLRDTHGTEK